MTETVFFDTECYPNYFLIVFKNVKGEVTYFERTETSSLDILALKKFISGKLLVGFNSKMYDIPMVARAVEGVDNSVLKNTSNMLIPDKVLLNLGKVKSGYDVICNLDIWKIKGVGYDHIDVQNVAKGMCSLKLYGARIGCNKLQDLPYNHLEPLSRPQMDEVRSYCINDVDITESLYNRLHEELSVRRDLNKEFGIDSRSKSDAQIADLVIGNACKLDRSLLKNKHVFGYNVGLKFAFKSEDLVKLKCDLNNVKFKVDKGSKIACEGIHRKLTINGVDYNFGIGGLHSNESGRVLIADNDEWYIDVDVSSCYPKIILNNKLSPKQLKNGFLETYDKFYHDRRKAKKIKDLVKSEVLKVVLNGSFGKFGDPYSDSLYDPELLTTTTITGQLGLLLLIERFEDNGFSVVSANTDGIVVTVKKEEYVEFRKVVSLWEKEFDYDTDEVKYKAIYSHSVNSYIAVKEDGSLKLKGTFAEKDLSRNVDVPICKKAVIDYLTKGVKIEDTIYNTKLEPMDLIKMRKTKFGAYWKGEYLGHTVRWYWSTEGESITNSKGHRVAETDHAYPIMDLDVPVKDIYYEKYIKKSYQLLAMVGVEPNKQKYEQLRLL